MNDSQLMCRLPDDETIISFVYFFCKYSTNKGGRVWPLERGHILSESKYSPIFQKKYFSVLSIFFNTFQISQDDSRGIGIDRYRINFSEGFFCSQILFVKDYTFCFKIGVKWSFLEGQIEGLKNVDFAGEVLKRSVQ